MKPIIAPLQPRVLNVVLLCAYLGRSETWFADHRDELEAAGFPKQVPILKGYDRAAVDAWLDKHSSLLHRLPAQPDASASWDRPKIVRSQ
jgi:predicted DNA-binding transcriptional regulator AlpA